MISPFRVFGCQRGEGGREESKFSIEIEKASWLDLILLIERKYKMEANARERRKGIFRVVGLGSRVESC